MRTNLSSPCATSMDVHRLRFLPVEPKAVHCLAFNDDSRRPKLAIARSDASIEIWRHTGEGRQLCHELTVPGRTDTSVEALLWYGKRLFSAGLTGHLHEWDLMSLQPLATADVMSTPVWSLALRKHTGTLAAGCEDGRVCLYGAEEGGGAHYIKTLNKMEGRILSLSWHPAGLVLAVGCSDSTVHLLDVDTGHCSLRITLDEFQSRATLVWDLKFLSDFSIITADSLGHVQLWNGEQGTLKQSFKLHSADVLALAVSEDENMVFAAGVDHKIIRLGRVTEGGRNSWVHSGSVRAHSHDVKSLAVSTNRLLASAGIDTRLVLYDFDTFGRMEETVKYSPFSSWSGRFAVASSASVLMYQGNTCLKFWRIPHSSHKADEIARSVINPPLSKWLSSGKEPVNFLDIQASTPRHILSSAISSDAALVAFSDIMSLWLYQLNSSVVCVGSWPHPACKLAFRRDGSELALACLKNGGGLETLAVRRAKEKKAKFHRLLDPDGEKPKKQSCFVDVLYSPDGGFLAAVDRKYRVFLFSASKHQLVAKIPHLCTSSLPRLCFSPWKPLLLIFNPQDKELAGYHLRKQVLLTVGEVRRFKRAIHRRDILGMASGIFPFYGQERLFGIYDVDCLSIVHIPKNCSKGVAPHAGTKRKRDSKIMPLKSIFDYRELLCAAALDSGDLLVVEKPWTDVMKALPPAMVRDGYGT